MNGNFQNMGGGRPQQVNPQAGGMQRNGGASTDVRLHIYNTIQGEPAPIGWQQMVNPQQRVGIIQQMVTGLQLVKPDMELRYAIDVATGFEMGEFKNAPDQETYNQAWRGKLNDIHKTRQNQANIQSAQLRNPQAVPMGLTPQQMQARGMMNNPNQFHPGFGMPPAAQPGQNLGVPMQQQLSQNQRLMQNGNPPNLQQPLPNGQSMPNVPRLGQQNRPQFTQEENQHINNLSNHLWANMSDQDKMNLQARVANMPITSRQQMHAQNIDPIRALVRQRATQTFLAQKVRRQQLAMQGMQNPGGGPMPSEGRPASQVNMHGQPSLPVSASHLQDSTFQAGHLDQILGQQREDALRSQAAGKDVVPASNIQGVPPHLRGTAQQLQAGQPPTNRPTQATTPFQPQPSVQNQWNGQQNMQQNMPYTPQSTRQAPTPTLTNMQGQTPQQALQGQLGGLNNNRAQRTSQQGHNMPNLNKPLDSLNQNNNNNTSKPPAQTPKQTPKPGGNAQSNNVNTNSANPGQQNPANPNLLHVQIAKLPAKFQEVLAKLPNDGARMQMMVEMQKRSQQQKLQAAAAAQSAGMTQASSQQGIQGQSQGLRVNQSSNAPSVPSTNAPVSQPGNSYVSQAPTNFPPAQPQAHHTNNGPPSQRPVPTPLSPQQMQFMDAHPFPPNILNHNHLANMPGNVKLWGQLKEYVQVNMPRFTKSIMDLQSIHLQQMNHSTAIQRMQMQQQQQQHQLAQNNPQFGQTGAAPQAPMVPQPNQAPPQNAAASGPFSLSNIPPPTTAELQQARISLPPHMANIPDDRLRAMIIQRRQATYARNPAMQQAQQNLLQLQRQGQQPQGSVGQAPPAPMRQPVRGPGQTPQVPQQQTQPQQTPKQAPQPPTQLGKSNQRLGGQVNTATHNAQTGPKQSTNDDVVEVSDPNATNQMTRPPNTRPNQPPSTNSMPTMTREDFNKLTPEQKMVFKARVQQYNAARAQQQMVKNSQSAPGQSLANHNINGMEIQFKRLKEEVEQSMRPRPAIPMKPKAKSQMLEKLREVTGNIKTLDETLHVFFYQIKEEQRTKDLYRARLLLVQQFRDSSLVQPKEEFTITLEETTEYMKQLSGHVALVTQHIRPSAQNNRAQQAQPGQPQQLNAANLQQQQAAFNAQRLAAQKNQANQSNKAPAAPTTREAPFSFGEHSPQGVPNYNPDVKAGLTQNDLKLPPGKKRKPNQSAASTPAEAKSTPVIPKASPLTKTESPTMQRISAAPILLKCPVDNCQSGGMGFTTKEDLEKHRVDVHEPKEPVITDVMDAAAYAIESLRLALNLDKDGKSRAPSQETKTDMMGLHAPTMKTTASSQSQTATKQEVSTPMSRVPTQTGPSSNILRTPQAAQNVKTPASDNKSAAKDTTTKISTADTSSATTNPNPWANSHVSREWFQEVFGGLGDLNRDVSPEFISNWLHRNPLTPETSPEGTDDDKDTPHKSDISANDDLNINIIADNDDMLLDPDWINGDLQDEIDRLDVSDLMNMDLDAKVEEEEVAGKGKRRRDQLDPSDEWFKFYAPDKWEERIRSEQGRKK